MAGARDTALENTELPPTEGEYESYAITPNEVDEEYQVIGTEGGQQVSFSRQYELPEKVDRDGVKAKLDHGVLTVILPKLQIDAPQTITID